MVPARWVLGAKSWLASSMPKLSPHCVCRPGQPRVGEEEPVRRCATIPSIPLGWHPCLVCLASSTRHAGELPYLWPGTDGLQVARAMQVVWRRLGLTLVTLYDTLADSPRTQKRMERRATMEAKASILDLIRAAYVLYGWIYRPSIPWLDSCRLCSLWLNIWTWYPSAWFAWCTCGQYPWLYA